MVQDHTKRPEVSGTIYGNTRKELLTAAGAKTAEYFGTTCVAVLLDNERPHGVMTGFNAEFRGQESHAVESRAYGPGRCRGCGKSSWPQDPLPRAKWE